jgi:hypothetical protein
LILRHMALSYGFRGCRLNPKLHILLTRASIASSRM